MISVLPNSLASHVLSQSGSAVTSQECVPVARFSANNAPDVDSASSPPTSRLAPTGESVRPISTQPVSAAQTPVGQSCDNILLRPQAAQRKAFELMGARRAELVQQIESCTDPKQLEMRKHRLADWDANADLMGVMRQMHETSLSMELAAKAIETGNAGIKQVSQTQT